MSEFKKEIARLLREHPNTEIRGYADDKSIPECEKVYDPAWETVGVCFIDICDIDDVIYRGDSEGLDGFFLVYGNCKEQAVRAYFGDDINNKLKHFSIDELYDILPWYEAILIRLY